MINEKIMLKLHAVFDNVFQTKIELFDDLSAKDIDSWDSLTHINLIASIQDEFNIKFSIKEMRSFVNVGDLVTIIKEKVE